ncbi:MAG TPA: lytic transglycosylase domain-containing protein [Candidatus Limnocylindrales bacterium]|nr:lytic transglycosylase domain-containing protein [Candidatus Limnocylindrales bacterium]
MLAAQIAASAADLAVLKNGATIPFLRKEQNGNVTRLYIPGGHLDINSSDIASYDKDDSVLAETPALPAATEAEAVAGSRPAPNSPAAAAPANAPAPQVNIDEVIRQASLRHQIDPDFVASVIRAESGFKPHAVSRKGAQGLMQLMPATAARLGVSDPFDPRANVEAGTAHLGALLDQYHNDPIKALAAYNAGSRRVEQYHGVPPYRETRAYVAKIVRDFNARKRAQIKSEAKASPAAASKKTKKNTQKKPAASQPQQASGSQAGQASLKNTRAIYN